MARTGEARGDDTGAYPEGLLAKLNLIAAQYNDDDLDAGYEGVLASAMRDV